MPAIDSEPMASGAAAGSTPQSKSPVCRSLPRIGGPALPICARRTSAPRPRRCASPAPCRDRESPAPPRRRSSRRRRRGSARRACSRMPAAIDRLLPERPEALALERLGRPSALPRPKNCFRRLSTARVRHIPRRISLRSSLVSERGDGLAREQSVARHRRSRRAPARAGGSPSRPASSRRCPPGR